MVFLPFVKTSGVFGFRGRLASWAVSGSCDVLSIVGVHDVGGDHRRGVFQAEE